MKKTLYIIIGIIVLSLGSTLVTNAATSFFNTKQGGTGTSTPPTADQILIGGNTAESYDVKTLTAGSNITIATTSGKVTINSTGLATSSLGAVTMNQLANYDWTFGNTFGAINLTASTSIPLWVKGQLNASTTIQADDHIRFHGTSTPASTPSGYLDFYAVTTNGITRPTYSDGCAEITVGRDNVYQARNTSGGTLTKGDAIYITGSTGNIPNISKAINSIGSVDSDGIVLSGIGATTIADNAYGCVMRSGVLSNINTSAFTSGDTLYLSTTTAGSMVNYRPLQPFSNTVMAMVLVSGVGNGSLYVQTAPFVGGVDSGTSNSYWAVGSSGSGTSTINSGGVASILPYASTTAITSSGSAYFATSGGNVGISTTTPLSALAVSGGASVGANYNTAAPTNGLIVEGNVGFGTTNPSHLLDVYGDAAVTPSIAVGVTGSTTSFLLQAGPNVSSGGAVGARMVMIDGGPSGKRWDITNGGITAGSLVFRQGTNGINALTLDSAGLVTAPYASTTMVTATTASTTALIVSGLAPGIAQITTGGALTVGDVNLAGQVTGDLPFANLTQIAGLSVLGVTGNSTADVAAITAGTDNQVLRRSGTSLAFGALNLASSDAVTGTLGFGNGGLGGTTYANCAIPFSTGSVFTSDVPNLCYNQTQNGLALGTSTPYARLTIWNPAGKFFEVANTASTTIFQIDGNGVASSTSFVNSGQTTLSSLGTGVVHAGATGILSSSAVNLASSDVTGVTPILNGGTAATSQTTNGVNYFNGTSITSGSTFQFNGSAVMIGTTSPAGLFVVAGSGATPGVMTLTHNSAGPNLKHWQLLSGSGSFVIRQLPDNLSGPSATNRFGISPTGLVSFGQASSTMFSSNGPLYVGMTATTTINGDHIASQLEYASTTMITASTASTTALIVSGLGNGSTQCLNIDGSGIVGSQACSSGGTVTSIDVAGGTTGLTFSGGPITTSGTITMAGTLGEANGGTNQTTYAKGDMLYASAANTLGKLTVGTGGTILASLNGIPTWTSTSTLLTTLNLTKGNFLVGNDAGVAQATSSIFVSSLGLIGIGSTTPSAGLSIGVNTSLAETPLYVATSTAMSLGLASSTYQVISYGTSATTITFSAYQLVPGMHAEIQTCSPGSAAGGAITWAAPTGYVLSASGGSAAIPGNTTQAGTCDLWDWQVIANKLASTTGQIILRGMTPSIP